MINDEQVWKTIDPEDIWILDKLILSRKLGYRCGPVGMDVPVDDWYIVRPCKNALGLGLGATFEYLKAEWNGTDHLTPGYFWCQIFHGRHFSVDYKNGEQVLCVEGIRDKNDPDLTRWKEWIRRKDIFPLPDILKDYTEKYPYMNCEYVDGHLIEVHLRLNPDFDNDITHFIPVWEGQDTTPPDGYSYKDYPDIHGRIGAFVK